MQMQTKKMGYLLIVLLLLSGFAYTVNAATTTVTFRGSGVTIDLTFPDEAHPLETITHNLTITSNANMTLQTFTISIKAPVNSSWQEIRKREEIGQSITQNVSWEVPLSMSLPQEANGTLSCSIYILTNQTIEPLSYKFYTTHVGVLTFSEMQTLYNEMVANYTSLISDYDGLLANYSALLTNYETLLSEYNTLSSQYDNKVSTYNTLLANYNALSTEHNTLNSKYQTLSSQYSTLQANYTSLNSTRYSVQGDYDMLNAAYTALNQTYFNLTAQLNALNEKIRLSTNALNLDKILMYVFIATLAGLIALIIYIKRKQAEPYVVIRKETVAVKPDDDES
jgi:uncharacterized protein YukE